MESKPRPWPSSGGSPKQPAQMHGEGRQFKLLPPDGAKVRVRDSKVFLRPEKVVKPGTLP